MHRTWPGWGNPGEDVPVVDVADLKAVWQVFERNKAQEQPLRGPIAVGMGIIAPACRSSNPGAVFCRCFPLQLLELLPENTLAAWRSNGQYADAVFRAAARMPLRWPEQGRPFKPNPMIEALLAELRKEKPDSADPQGEQR
jgi:hypothetical protein